jgi:hypothetical protein
MAEMSLPLDNRQRPAIIARLRAMAGELGRLPTKLEFWRATRIPLKTVKKLFGGHRALLSAAGFETYGSRRLLTNEVLLRGMRDAFEAAGGIVGRDLFSQFCRHDNRTLFRRWGSWPRALAALRDWLESREPDFPHLPQLREQCAGIKADVFPLPLAPRCGELLRFRALDHAPTTENAVIFLFGLVAEELGFILDNLRAAYPDAVGRRRVGDGWRHVRIEFELLSRSFHDHGHNAKHCDLIVCWEDNWPECPVEVLELKRVIAPLGGIPGGEGLTRPADAAAHRDRNLTKTPGCLPEKVAARSRQRA